MDQKYEGLNEHLINAISSANLLKIDEIMALDIWSKVDKYPFNYIMGDNSSTIKIDLLSDDELLDIGLSSFNAVIKASSIKEVVTLSEKFIRDKMYFCDFIYKLYHLRGYWYNVYIKCFKYLVAHKTTNWNVYKFLDYPLMTDNIFLKPPYAEQEYSKPYMHIAIDTGMFEEKKYYDECFSLYDNRFKQVDLEDGQFSNTHYRLSSFKEFLEKSVKVFPNCKEYYKALLQVHNVEAMMETEFYSHIDTNTLMFEAEQIEKKKTRYLYYDNKTLAGRVISPFEAYYIINKIDRYKYDWVINPFNRNINYIKDYLVPKCKDEYLPSWEFAFTFFAYFKGFDWIRPYKVAKQFYIDFLEKGKNANRKFNGLKNEEEERLWSENSAKNIADIIKGSVYNKFHEKGIDIIEYKKQSYKLKANKTFILIIDEASFQDKLIDKSTVPSK